MWQCFFLEKLYDINEGELQGKALKKNSKKLVEMSSDTTQAGAEYVDGAEFLNNHID